MARVLVLTSDTVAPTMAGPAMRALAIAEHCTRAGHQAALATTGRVTEGSGNGTSVIGVDQDGAARLAAEHDIVILQGHVLRARLAELPPTVRLVIDAYDPIHIEQLAATTRLEPVRRQALYDETIRSLDEQFRRADFVMCASDDQRALWLGHLAAVGRIDPATFDADPTLRGLIDVVPFGLPSGPPQRTGLGARGRLPGVEPTDTLLLWNGGIYTQTPPAEGNLLPDTGE